ncbi:MAG: hypothetical protein ACLTSZ_05145 [Lachnospiraceae bacterium]
MKNKYLLIGLSVFCVALILLSFFEGDAVAPVRQVSGFVITPIQKGNQRVRLVAVRPYR